MTSARVSASRTFGVAPSHVSRVTGRVGARLRGAAVGLALGVGLCTGVLGLGGAHALGIGNGFDLRVYAVAVMGPESAGNYGAMNSSSEAAGAYQFLAPSLAETGIVSCTGRRWDSCTWTARARSEGVSSLDEFLHTEAGRRLQDQGFAEFTTMHWRRLSDESKSSIGLERGGAVVTEGGLLSAAHFLGAGGMNQFVASGFTGRDLKNLPLILAQNGFRNVAELDAYVMSRIRSGAAAHGEVPEGAPPMTVSGLGLTCQLAPVLDPVGLVVTSPFGVDRTGRASAAFHVGLDMVNDQGRGAPLRAGIEGRVVSAGGASNGILMETADGRQRFGFLHNDVVYRDVGAEVAPDDVVARMGDRGSPGSVHLHLMTALRADVAREAAESLGKVWSVGQGYGNQGLPLSDAALRDVLPESWIVVNPETFLYERIPFRPHLLTEPQYVAQGLSRPDALTLPNTCGPMRWDVDGTASIRSTNGGTTVDGGYTQTGVGLVSSGQVAAGLAAHEARDALIEAASSSMGLNVRQRAQSRSAGMRTATWAAVLLQTTNELATPGM